MIKLKIQKYKQINIIKPFNIKKTNIPTKLGITKKYKYFIVNYFLIILLQKYGFCLSKGLQKIIVTKFLKTS